MRTLKVFLLLMVLLSSVSFVFADPATDLARGSFRTTYNYATGKIDFYRMYNGSDFCLPDGSNCALGGGGNSTSDGTGGWTNTSTTTSTNLNVTIIQPLIINRSGAGYAYQLFSRDVTNISVPSFSSAVNNTVVALDVFPKGSPTEYGTNGYAWLDVCDTDMMYNNSPVNCGRISARSDRIEFGSVQFNNPSMKKSLYLTAGGLSGQMVLDGTNITFNGNNPVSTFTFTNNNFNGSYLGLYDSAWTVGERKKLVQTFSGTTPITSVDVVYSATGKADIRFTPYNAGQTTDAMNIRYDGNVGIGTTAPTQKLDVNGSVNVSTNVFISAGVLAITTIAGPTIRMYGGVANHTYIEWYAHNSSSSRSAYMGYGGAGTTHLSILNQLNGAVGIGANNAPNILVVNSNGNTGIGVGTVSQTHKLTVNGSANVTGTVYANGYAVCQSDGTNCPASSGDNSSWNESGATILFYPRDSNPQGFYNSSTIPSYVLVSSLAGAVGQNLTYDLINTNMGNWSADKSSYTLLSTLSGAVGQNLTYALVAANIGNWTLDKSSYVPWSSISGAVGQNLTYALVGANIGNWSADKASYALNTHVANVNTTANIQLLGFNTTTQLNVVYVRNASIPTCGGTDKLTSAGNGIFTCATDQTGGGSSAGSGWLNTTNQVYLSNNATNVTVGKNTDSLPNLFVDNTNNFVGINTINPTTNLEVNGSSLVKGVLTVYSGQADAVAVAVGGPLTTYAALQFVSEQNRTRDFIFSSVNNSVQSARMAFRVSGNEAGSNSGGDLSILRFDDSGTFIDTPFKVDRSDGYIGIGDVTPDAKLDVVGDVIIDGNLTLDGVVVHKSWTNYTTAKQNVHGTTLANITGLQWNAAANTNYTFDCDLFYQSNLTTNGISFAMEDWGGTVTWFEVGSEIHTVAAATVNSATANTTGTKMTSTAVAVVNTKYRASLNGIIINGASAVTITPQFSAEIAGSNSSIMRGSHCDVKVI